ncbi:MAG: hypothetical protein K2X93_07660 [Candidatus Obscuribacterales bacterium]|nr:hypothetical protein [Candidatus Obscuribacterales bacterium]
MALPERIRKIAFLCANLLVIALVYSTIMGLNVQYFARYVVVVLCFYFLTLKLANRGMWLAAVWAPILFLAGTRYFGPASMTYEFIGLSYMAFRLSQLVIIVRNRMVAMPSFLDYLGFSFFVPTLFVGPISSYTTFAASYSSVDRTRFPVDVCVQRIAVGAVKVLYLGAVLERVSYSGFLLDGNAHPPVDLVIAAIAYYLYFYCNFSGFCDVMIGAAGLLGIKVSENFNNPLSARNVQDFWNRWHITLTNYMKDMFFTPVAKALVTRLPPALSKHAIALTILMVFALIGLWHGREIRYVIWGALNGAAVVINYYYDIFLRRYLSRDQLNWYRKNRIIHALAVVITFSFICASLFFVGVNSEDMRGIFEKISNR